MSHSESEKSSMNWIAVFAAAVAVALTAWDIPQFLKYARASTQDEAKAICAEKRGVLLLPIVCAVPRGGISLLIYGAL